MKQTRTLRELFSLSGFNAQSQLQGVFGDPKARMIELKRQKKDRVAQDVATATGIITIPNCDKYEISMRRDGGPIFAMSKGE